MKIRQALALSLLMFGAGWTVAAWQKPEPGGYILERDAESLRIVPGSQVRHWGAGNCSPAASRKFATALERPSICSLRSLLGVLGE